MHDHDTCSIKGLSTYALKQKRYKNVLLPTKEFDLFEVSTYTVYRIVEPEKITILRSHLIPGNIFMLRNSIKIVKCTD